MFSDGFDKKTKQAICTQTGSAVSTLLLYPIDTVRFRAMSHDTTTARLHHNNQRYRGVLEPMRLIVTHEGAGALYRGACIAVGGAAASWGIYVYMYRSLQQLSQERLHWAASFEADLFNSTVASVGTAFLTTPIWHVKTRMQIEDTTGKQRALNNSSSTAARPERKYAHFVPGLINVAKSDGVLGLWRGFAPQFLMSVVNGAYLPVYSRTLAWFNSGEASSWTSRSSKSDSKSSSNSSFAPSSWTVALASASTRTVISIISNPLFVVRTKLQDERHSIVPSVVYRNLAGAAKVIWREEGIRGFYRGIRATLAITAPKAVATMVVTEKLYQLC